MQKLIQNLESPWESLAVLETKFSSVRDPMTRTQREESRSLAGTMSKNPTNLSFNQQWRNHDMLALRININQFFLVDMVVAIVFRVRLSSQDKVDLRSTSSVPKTYV